MAVTYKGGTTGSLQEVETATLAARVTLHPNDPGALGAYQIALTSGTIAAGLAAAAPVFSFRYGGSNLCLVRRVRLTVGDLVAFAAGLVAFNMFAARAFTASDTGGIAATLTANNGKLRTSYAATGVSDFRIANTAALGAGTRTLDAQAMATFSTSFPASPAGQPLSWQHIDLWRPNNGEHPLGLANNEGFVIQATVPATGTWQLGVEVGWDEQAIE